MKQIKTVIRPITQAKLFDADINRHTAAGWTLKKRETLKIPGEPSEAFNVAFTPALYAELERECPPWPDEITQ